MHGSFWVSPFRDSHITTALIISCVFMQKQEKLVSHLNNNEFVHNNNKSLFLAKKTTSVHIEGFVWIMQAFWLIIVNRYEFQLPWLQITKYIWWFKNPSLIWWFDNRCFDVNYRTPVYVNLFISMKWYIRCRAVLLPLELMSVSGNK